MMKLIVTLFALLAVASAQCDAQAAVSCASGFTGIGLDPTRLCATVRDLLACYLRACPQLANEPSVAAGIQQFQDQCGLVIPGSIANAGFCALMGDPHVRSYNGRFSTCALTGGPVEVFRDAANVVSITASANPAWQNQQLTAVRSVSVTNNGVTRNFTAGSSSFTTGTTTGTLPTGVTANANAFVDDNTKLHVRVAQFSNVAGNQHWINVYILSPRSGASGICVDGCPASKRVATPTIEELHKRATLVGRQAAACQGKNLDTNALAACIADVGNTGETAFADSAADYNSERSLAAPSSGNGGFASTLSASFALVAVIVMAALF